MKKGLIITAAVLVVLLFVGFNGLYTVAENEYVCVMRFSEIVSVQDSAGLHFKIPFIDSTRSFPKTTLIYDIPPSEVLTSDKKNMTVDSYIIWEIADPRTFYRTLGTTGEAEARLNAVTYNSLKNLMGRLQQDDIINTEDASGRNDIYAGITTEVAELCTTYGINVLDVRIKRFDLAQLHQSLTVRRVANDRSLLFRARLFNFSRIRTEEFNILRHAGALRVFPRVLQDLFVHVRAEDLGMHVAAHKVARLLLCLFPDVVMQAIKLHRGKFAVKTGGDITQDHRIFNNDRTGPAKRVPEKDVLARTRRQRQRRTQCFTQGCRTRRRAVTALMERHAAGIDHQRCHVLEDKELNLIFRALLGEPFDAVSIGKALHDRLFHNTLTIRHGIQL